MSVRVGPFCPFNTKQLHYLIEHAKPSDICPGGHIYQSSIQLFPDQAPFEVIIKCMDNWKGCMDHEFEVAAILCNLNCTGAMSVTKAFALLDHPTKPDVQCMVMEKVHGEPMHYFAQKADVANCRLIWIQLLHTLLELQHKAHFTHYDLHNCNFIIETLPFCQTLVYRYDGQSYTVASPYAIKLIDFDSSYVDGVSGGFKRIAPVLVASGVVPVVHDPLTDLCMIAAAMYADIDDPSPLNHVIRKCGYAHCTPRKDRRPSDDYFSMSLISYIGRQLITERWQWQIGNMESDRVYMDADDCGSSEDTDKIEADLTLARTLYKKKNITTKDFFHLAARGIAARKQAHVAKHAHLKQELVTLMIASLTTSVKTKRDHSYLDRRIDEVLYPTMAATMPSHYPAHIFISGAVSS